MIGYLPYQLVSRVFSINSITYFQIFSFPTFQAFFRPVERSPSRTPRRVSAKTPPSTPTKMPPTTPAKTPPATPKKIRGPIVSLKEGVQRCHARIWAQGRGGQCLGWQRLQTVGDEMFYQKGNFFKSDICEFFRTNSRIILRKFGSGRRKGLQNSSSGAAPQILPNWKFKVRSVAMSRNPAYKNGVISSLKCTHVYKLSWSLFVEPCFGPEESGLWKCL